MTKLWKCESCEKEINTVVYLIPFSEEKTALCSKHFRKWLVIKSKYYNMAVEEFLTQED